MFAAAVKSRPATNAKTRPAEGRHRHEAGAASGFHASVDGQQNAARKRPRGRRERRAAHLTQPLGRTVQYRDNGNATRKRSRLSQTGVLDSAARTQPRGSAGRRPAEHEECARAVNKIVLIVIIVLIIIVVIITIIIVIISQR